MRTYTHTTPISACIKGSVTYTLVLSLSLTLSPSLSLSLPLSLPPPPHPPPPPLPLPPPSLPFSIYLSFPLSLIYMYRTAPEALTRAKFSTASDVWSYGVVLWEIYSLGKIPWDRLSPIEIRDLLLRGERLARPDRCPLDMYEMMLDCWDQTPQDRPTFGILVQRVETVSLALLI